MNHRPATSVGLSKITGHWDGLSTIERVKMILANADHFLFYGIITRQELQVAMATSEAEWEYIIDRQDQPLFHNINIKKEVRMQALRNQLKAALCAVFL